MKRFLTQFLQKKQRKPRSRKNIEKPIIVVVNSNKTTNWILASIALLSFILNWGIYIKSQPKTEFSIVQTTLCINESALKIEADYHKYYILFEISNDGNIPITAQDFGFYVSDPSCGKLKTYAEYEYNPKFIEPYRTELFLFQINMFYREQDLMPVDQLEEYRHKLGYQNIPYSDWARLTTQSQKGGLFVNKISLKVPITIDSKIAFRGKKNHQIKISNSFDEIIILPLINIMGRHTN